MKVFYSPGDLLFYHINKSLYWYAIYLGEYTFFYISDYGTGVQSTIAQYYHKYPPIFKKIVSVSKIINKQKFLDK